MDFGSTEDLQKQIDDLNKEHKIKQYEARLVEVQKQQIQLMLNMQKLTKEKTDVQEHLNKLKGENNG